MDRLTRLLLRLYSSDFRTRFGPQAVRDLRSDVDEARTRGGLRGPADAAGLLVAFAATGIIDRAAGFLGRLGSPGTWARGGRTDVRLALRSAARRPGFLLIAVTSLVIGVGANTVVFTLADTLMMRDIPGADDPDRIVELQMLGPDGRSSGWAMPDFAAVRDRIGALSAVAMYDANAFTVSDGGAGSRLLGQHVTSGYFDVFGVSMQLGRAFVPEEDRGPGRHPVVILSHDTWRGRYGADPGVLGRTIRLNREEYTVVGVVEEGFRGNHFSVEPAVYLPLTQHDEARLAPDRFFGDRGTRWASVVGRLADDADRLAVNAALDAVATRLSEEAPETNAGWRMHAVPAALAPAEARAPLRVAFALLGVLVALVLATACANVGGMLLARASDQEYDLAVRMALGAGRSRLIRLLLFEALVIFVLGGVGGVLFAARAIAAFDINALLPTPFPVHFELVLDWRLLVFGLVLTVGTGLTFGLLPALRVTRTGLIDALREQAGATGLRASRLRRLFVAGQLSVSIMLLATATLVYRTTERNASRAPAFTPEGVWVTRFQLDQEGYRATDDGVRFVGRLLEHLRRQPGVGGAMAATSVPLDGRSSSGPVWPGGRRTDDGAWIQADYMRVSDGFFETLDIELLTGRTFRASDGPAAPRVAVVSRTLAEAAWPGDDALGRTLSYGLDSLEYTVVGIVADTRSDLVTDPLSPQLYTPLAQDWDPRIGVFVRDVRGEEGFDERLSTAFHQVDPALATGTSQRLTDLADIGLLPYRIVSVIATTLGALALFLAAIGVYGLIAYTVSRQTREIGLRLALGARRGQVVGRVLTSGLRLAFPGFVLGVLLAAALAQILRTVVYGLEPFDPLAYGAVAAVLLAVVIAAAILPARQASAIDPMEALRAD